MKEPLHLDEGERGLIEGARKYCKNYAGSLSSIAGHIVALIVVGLVAGVAAMGVAFLITGEIDPVWWQGLGLVGVGLIVWNFFWRMAQREDRKARLLVKLADAQAERPPLETAKNATGGPA
jgi:hypothetical protein